MDFIYMDSFYFPVKCSDIGRRFSLLYISIKVIYWENVIWVFIMK